MQPKLNIVAAALMERISAIAAVAPIKTTPPAAWDSLQTFYHGNYPTDYIELMSRFPFEYITLEYHYLDKDGRSPDWPQVYFRFRSQISGLGLEPALGEDDSIRDQGYAIIGEGQGGDLWVVRQDHGVNGPVYYISSTRGGHCPLTPDVSFVFAANSLAHLIAGFSLTDCDYGFNHRTLKTEARLGLELFFPYDPGDEIYRNGA